MVLIKPRPDYEGAFRRIRYLLESHLPPNASYYVKGELPYHGIKHTDDVVLTAEEIARKHEEIKGEVLGNEGRNLIRLGAVEHDLGLIRTYKGHEEAGTSILRDILPDYGFTQGLRELVCEMPLATKLLQGPGPLQDPKNLFECIICEADTGNFGRTGTKDGFFPNTHKIKQEMELVEGKKMSLIGLYDMGYGLLERHEYFTDGGRSLGEEGKKKNMRELRLRIKRLAEIPPGEERAKLEELYLRGERFELPDYFAQIVQMPQGVSERRPDRRVE